MKQETKHVSCPKCGTKIDVNDLLYHQLQDQAQKEFDSKYSEFKNEKKEFEKKKSELQESIDKGVTARLASEKSKLEKRLREQIAEEKSEEIKSLSEQLDMKSKEAKELNKIKAENIRIKREHDELRDKIELESEQKLTQRLTEEQKKIRKEVEDKMQFKVLEKEHVIDQLKQQLTDAQRKAEQGSMQTQGEVMELELEKLLKAAFPFDEVVEISKGQNGADLVMTIKNLGQQPCGIITIESKRTKTFSNTWFDKLRSDQRSHKADIAILVTEIMPRDMNQFGLREGVWVCSFAEVKALVFVLRESLLRISEIKSANEGRTDKMGRLYNYLISQDFASQIQMLMQTFSGLKLNLENEKKVMLKIWKEREKQIEGAVLATAEIFGSVKGIAGAAIKPVESLEFHVAGELEEKTHTNS